MIEYTNCNITTQINNNIHSAAKKILNIRMLRGGIGDLLPFLLQHPLVEQRLLPQSFPSTNADLVDDLSRMYSDTRILDAFRAVDRGKFTASGNPGARGCYADIPYRDELVHLSAPSIYADALVAFLPVSPALRILLVGSGSGYFAALLNELGKQGGSVKGGCPYIVGVEVKPELVAFSSRKLSKHKNIIFKNCSIFDLELDSPCTFDRIYVGAACEQTLVDALLELLSSDGGVLVGPVATEDDGQMLTKFTKTADDCVETEELKAVMFAPLLDVEGDDKFAIHDQAWSRDIADVFSDKFNCDLAEIATIPLLPDEVWWNMVFGWTSRGWFTN